MAGNYVEIKVKARDDAKPDLTALRADLDSLGAKTETAKVKVDDADAKAKLLAINAELARLNRTVANPRITVAGAARAEARIAALDAQLKRMGDNKAPTTLKGRLLALGGTASTLGGLGDVFGAFNSEASTAQRVMSGVGAATGLLEAPVSGLIVGVGGLASGLAAAGAGLVAFGAVAKANLSTAATAASAVQQAQITYNASLKAGMNQAKAYQAEQKAIGVAYAQLSPAQIALSKQIGDAQSAWQGFVQSNTSGVSKILSQGIGLLPKIFASMQPFMAPVEKAISGLVTQLGHGLNSGGFKSFIDMLAKNSGPAITKIGTAIGHVVVGLGGIIKAFMPFAQTMLSGLDQITAKFAHWGSTLTQHNGFKSLTSMAKQDMPYVITIVKNLGSAFMHLGGSMAGLSTFSNSASLLKLAAPLSQLLNTLVKANPQLVTFGLYLLAAGQAGAKLKAVFGEGGAIGNLVGSVKGGVSAMRNLKSGFTDAESAASAATGVWGTFGGKISTAITAIKSWGVWSKLAAAATKVWTGIQAAFDAVMDANPIALVVIAIAALVAGIIYAYTHFKGFRDFVKAAGRDIATAFTFLWHAADVAFHAVVHAVAVAFDWIKGHWSLILAILTGPVGLAVRFIVQHWQQIYTGAVNMVHSVVTWFRNLPHMILTAVGNLGNLLFTAGKNIIQGLISGITSMAGSVGHAIGGIVSDIRNFLPFSPAKKGPLSGSGSPDRAGAKIASMLAAGMTGASGAVAGAAARMAGAAVGGYGVPAAAVAGGGGRTYNVHVSVSPLSNPVDVGRQLVNAIREFERSSGKGWRS